MNYPDVGVYVNLQYFGYTYHVIAIQCKYMMYNIGYFRYRFEYTNGLYRSVGCEINGQDLTYIAPCTWPSLAAETIVIRIIVFEEIGKHIHRTLRNVSQVHVIE